MDTLARQVEQEVPFLRKLVRRWCQEKAHADDLVQDTVVRALTYASTYEPGTNLRAWLSTIMRNEFLSGRQKAASLTSMLRVFAESDHGAGGDPSEERHKLRDVSRALTRLPAEQRRAVYYMCIEGMSYEDAAKAMGASVASVRMNLSRGRNRLRTAVEGEQPRSLFALPRRNPARGRADQEIELASLDGDPVDLSGIPA